MNTATFEEIIAGRKKGLWIWFIRFLFQALSFGMKAAVNGRHFFYERGWIAQAECSTFVVSVGNIVAGGAGKTPFVEMLAKRLQESGKVAILSSGYRSQAARSKKPVVMSSGQGPSLTAEVGGDEAYLLSSNVPEAIVISGRDRVKSSQMASQLGAKVLLLDDGMQYRRLKKHIEIVVLNGSDPFGGGSFLPGGFLRDEPSRLRLADLIVIHGPLKNLKHLDKIERFTTAPIVYAHSAVQGVHFFEKECAIDLKATPVAVFCGIAAPHRFVETVENEIGANVVLTHFLGDHQGWTQEAFEQFLSQAKERGCKAVLCTEKDAVKLKNFKKTLVPVAWVKRELTIQKNEEALEALVLTIKTRMIQ